MPSLTLVSASPRRRQLLEWAGFTVSLEIPGISEALIAGEDPVDTALRLAAAKGAASRARTRIAADTVVHLDGIILDKPLNRATARAHLRTLSGRWHCVTTAFFAGHGEASALRAVSTEVRFRTLTEREIEAYLATGEADDKAGAYAIQGLGGALVAEVRGSWTNVMGLPLEETLEALQKLGVSE